MEKYQQDDLEELTETEDTENVEPINPFAAPELPPEDPDPYMQVPSDMVIIPKIVIRKIDDPDVEEIIEDQAEDEEDKHQHYFSDQVHFERPKWDKVWFNAVAMIAFSVDLSNLTDFPREVATQGGFVFIFAYICVVVFLAYPMMYLEALLGQYFQTGMIGIWGLVPMARGLGPALFYVTFLVVSVIPSNTLWAFLMVSEAVTSIKSGTLPWISCENDWNTCNCTNTRVPVCLSYHQENYKPETGYPSGVPNVTHSSTKEYFIGKVLTMWKTKYTDPLITKDFPQNGNWSLAYGFQNQKEGLGPLIPTSCVVLLIIYVLLLTFNIINFNFLGYFYTFTTGFSVFVLALLFCRACTLEGSFDGLVKYYSTDFSKLFDLAMWTSAFNTAFFSIGSGSGCQLMMSSFNALNHNIQRDVTICIVVDTLISLMGCTVAFMFIGHLYHLAHIHLPDTFPGDNLVFITLAQSFSAVSGSSFFAAMFYAMIIVFSIDTQVVGLCALSFSLYEEFKRKYPDQYVSRLQFLFSVWGFSFSIALVCATRGGYWVFIFVLKYAYGQNSLIFMLIESIIFAWIWGVEEVCNATEFILGHRPGMFLRICWKFILPSLLLGILVQSNAVLSVTPLVVFGQNSPPETPRAGYFFQLLSIVMIIAYAIFVFIGYRRKNRTCLQTFMMMISPEYEHENIVADINSAKRLHWKHYAFLQFEDELKDMRMKERLSHAFQKVKKILHRPKKGLSKPVEVPETPSGKKKEKKKKKKKADPEAQAEAEDSAWQLWDKIKKEQEEEESSMMETTTTNSNTSTKKKMAKKTVRVPTSKPVSSTSTKRMGVGPPVQRKPIRKPITSNKVKPVGKK